MARFVVNKGDADEKEFEADEYALNDGYFNFYDEEGSLIASVDARHTRSVQKA